MPARSGDLIEETGSTGAVATRPAHEDEADPAQRDAALDTLRRTPVFRFVVLILLLGSAAFIAAIVTGSFRPLLSAEAVMFALFVVLGELLPIVVPRKGEQDEITISTTFSLALLLVAGVAPALLAQVVGSVVSDMVRRKPVWKAVFNAGQYTLALWGASLTLRLLSAEDGFRLDEHLTARNLPPILAAGAAFFLVNTVVTGTALAKAQQIPVAGYLWRDIVAQLSTDGVLLVLTPIVLLVSQTSLLLVPLIVVPMVAVYQSTRVSLENASLVLRLEESLSELRELNRVNEHQALHDSLTGLPNRILFVDRATQAIRTARRDGHGVALLIVDLDGFKDINDTLGHHHGDLLLKEIGQRLQAALRESDTIARVGGDEFGVLIPFVDDAEAALTVAERIRQALAEPVDVQGLVLHVDASIGISLYPRHGLDADTLIQRADLAMYVAKGGNLGYQIYTNKHDRDSRSRLALLAELRRALDEGELILHYQPKVSLQSGRVVGVEALIRWQHPSGELIWPQEFIPFAEHSGLIGPLTRYVLEAALRQARKWMDAGLDLTVAVNLSARNVIDLQLPQDVARELNRWGVPAERLGLEITESALVGEAIRAMEVLNGLNEMGVSLSLDDFGTGYSSLAALKRLPVNEIKIDRSFVMNMTTVESDAVIVRSTVDLGHNLGLQVVAEGVEGAETFRRLADLGCDVAQGFYMSRPLSASRIPAWIRRAGVPPGGEPRGRPSPRGPIEATRMPANRS